jgi:hypothetical protein
MVTKYLVLDLPWDNEAATALLNKHAGHGWRVVGTVPAISRDTETVATVILQLDTPHRMGDGT